MFELFKKHSIKTFNNSSKNEQLGSNETLLLSQFRGDIWKLAYNNMLSEEGLIKELISAIGVFFDAERCVFSRINNDKIYADIEWKHNKVKAAASDFSVPLDLIEKLDVDIQRTITLEDMMEAISGPKMGFLKPFIDLMAAAIGDAPSLSTPVKVNGRIFGFITMRFFDSKVEMYTQNVKDVITDAANIIALAIERRRSEEMFRASFNLNPDAMIF
ncbi:MAG TPA: GAF domain-containing protein, partial [Candidatus Goldiibacteriota bacterium]|nr:GAF domain-containing protein [Candidatus Goldiibacteriota bacterium]